MWGKNPAQGFKNPAGFSKNPAGFLTLTFFFTMTEFLFWGLNAYEPRHAIMCLREINYVMRYDVVKSDVIISRRAYLKRVSSMIRAI